jgi:chromosome segregation ATPase
MRTGDNRKIILLFLFIIVLVVAGVLLIDFVGTLFGIQIPLPGLTVIKEATLTRKIKQSENPYLLEREEIGKELERISLINEQIVNRQKEVEAKESATDKKLEELKKRETELEKKARILDDREKQYSDKQKNIREQAEKLYNMPPEDAVALLEKQAEADIVDILRAIDAYSAELGSQSTAPFMLKLMGDINSEKAANVLRKLKYSAGEESSAVDILDEDSELIPEP